MPFAAPRQCLRPGCPAKVARGYCPDHTTPTIDRRPADRAYDATRPNAAQRGYCSTHWKRMRAMVMAKGPACVECGHPGQQVDHIVPVSKGGAFYDAANLQVLCHSCHSKKTRAESQ